MIIPSIDIAGGQTVQLVQGETPKIQAGDPAPIADRFGMVGEVAVIDLDAAKGEGDNRELIEPLLRRARCRVGGGIRDADTALRWLDSGAERVILGTAATPEILEQLPRDRVIAAVDARDGEVVTHGWRTKSGRRIEDVIAELKPFAAGFLVTFVETEGTMTGIDTGRAHELAQLAGEGAFPCKLTAAGGVRTAGEIGELDRLGIDAQVGMAIYSGAITLADAVWACATTDRPDGLAATVVCDTANEALGLCYSSHESLTVALDEQRGVYHSRTRGLWRKGETSGATQRLLAVDLDCDRDALRFTVEQSAGTGFCHLPQRTCFGDGRGLRRLARRLASIASDGAAQGSYTARLLADPALLEAKLVEEAHELAEADSTDHIASEAADLLYFALVRLAAAGVPLDAIDRELDRRERKVHRRSGDAKPSVQTKIRERKASS